MDEMIDGPDRGHLQWLFERVLEDYTYQREQRNALRRWAITLWGAALVASASARVELEPFSVPFLLVPSLGVSWLLEMFISSTLIRRERILRRIENQLALGHPDAQDSLGLYMFSLDKASAGELRRADIAEAIATKTRAHFVYGSLLVVSLTYILLS